MVKQAQTSVEPMEEMIGVVQDCFHREIGTLKEEMLAMNRKFD